MAPHDDDVAPDALLLAAAQAQSDLEALLGLLEQTPEDWSRPEYVSAWVRAARHVGTQAVLGAHVLGGLQRTEARLRGLCVAVVVAVVVQGLLLLAYTWAWAMA